LKDQIYLLRNTNRIILIEKGYDFYLKMEDDFLTTVVEAEFIDGDTESTIDIDVKDFNDLFEYIGEL
jgi:hypothetical protein